MATAFFLIWMLFFDGDNMLKQRELYQENEELREEMLFLKKEIAKTREQKERLERPGELEKFAREQYFFHRENEDILVIEYADSLEASAFPEQSK